MQNVNVNVEETIQRKFRRYLLALYDCLLLLRYGFTARTKIDERELLPMHFASQRHDIVSTRKASDYNANSQGERVFRENASA